MISAADVDIVEPYQASAIDYSYRVSVGAKPNFGVDEGKFMNERITKAETIIDNHEKVIAEVRSDFKEIRSDIQGLERRLIDKMDENHKWLVGLIISSILVPLFIALVTK